MSARPMLPFNRPAIVGHEKTMIGDALQRDSLSGDGFYSRKCEDWFEKTLGCQKAFLTPSCTHSLEMAALLLDLGEGDEVIMPSYTFPSTANAFVLRGATIAFVDIRADTMNLDEELVEAVVTNRRAIPHQTVDGTMGHLCWQPGKADQIPR